MKPSVGLCVIWAEGSLKLSYEGGDVTASYSPNRSFCTELGISSRHGSKDTSNTNCTDKYHPRCFSGHQPIAEAQGQHWLWTPSQECGCIFPFLIKCSQAVSWKLFPGMYISLCSGDVSWGPCWTRPQLSFLAGIQVLPTATCRTFLREERR